MRIDIDVLPSPFDARKAADAVDEVLNGLEDGAARAAVESEAGRALAAAMAGNSTHLARCMQAHPIFFARLLTEAPDDLLADEMDSLRREAPEAESDKALMRRLRRAKGRVALLTAAADLAQVWTLEKVMAALSDFADLTLQLAAARALHERIRKGELVAPEGAPDTPVPELARATGFFVLALGKLGARELNYSSDIDLIALYDEEVVAVTDKRSASDCMLRIVKEIVRLLDTRTGDGYVFRIDLRLRPDAGATPIALSVDGAESYYQSVAQNWERAAMIKARVAAGDNAAGEAYLARLAPFIWRRSLDYAAIEDIHALKDQIHRHHRHKSGELAGLDVKLSPGGIRTIEFYAQINQLIFGGRDPSLRAPQTLAALEAMVAAGWIEATARDDLAAAYMYLRKLEHRLQMREDRQTHELPSDDKERRAVAAFMGHDSLEAFETALSGHIERVQAHYDALLPPGLPAGEEGGLSDEALRACLKSGGFEAIDTALDIIERWRRGRYRALHTARARKLMEGSLDKLLAAFSATAEPDAALTRFDRFLSQLPAGVQLFAMLSANPWLFEVTGRIMGVAPALAERLAKRPHLFDAMMEADFFAALPDRSALADDLETALSRARDYEDVLDIARRWTDEHRFQLGVQTLEGVADIRLATESMTDLAEVTIEALLPRVQQEYAKRYGDFPGGALGVVAMGKFGGRELSFGSDLDFVLLYELRGEAEQSDGEKPVGPSRYFSGLGQALITALTALTAEGRLWEVDTRLRPSGRAGPLVVTLETFSDYYAHTAWTWEHMALTRARVVAGPARFARRIESAIARTLSEERNTETLLPAVAQMRERLAREFPVDSPWSVKHVRGGLIDMEFIAQYLLLREAARHPDVLAPRLDDCFDRLVSAKSLDPHDGEALKAAHALYTAVQSLLRLTVTGEPDEAAFTPDLCAALARAAWRDDFETLKRDLESAQRDVYTVYEKIIAGPAALVTPSGPAQMS